MNTVSDFLEKALAAADSLVYAECQPGFIMMNPRQYRDFRWVLCEYGEDAARRFLFERGIA